MRSVLLLILILLALAAPAAAQNPAPDMDAEIGKFLTRNRWCMLADPNNAKRSEAVAFAADGSADVTGNAGPPAGPYKKRYRWRVQQGGLEFSGDGKAWTPVDLDGRKDAKGIIVLTLAGDRYVACK